MGMSVLRVTPEKVKIKASEFEEESRELKAITGQMFMIIHQINGVGWFGSSAQAYTDKFKKLDADCNKMVKMVRMYSEHLKEIAGEYIAAEKINEDTVRALKVNVLSNGVAGDRSVNGDNKRNDSVWEKIKQWGEKKGMTILEIMSFWNDLKKILGKAGMEALSSVFTNGTDWEAWFMQYVPENVADETILGIFSLLSVTGMSEDIVEEHKKHNDAAWEKYQSEYCIGNYIENQSAMDDIQYGNHNGAYNACEVIAVYNALQYLTDGASPDSFPELLEIFEKDGITANGEFGTSPQALNSYFEEKGYDTHMLVGDGISSSNMSELSQDYDTYIMTTYNDKSNLNAMVHTVSITLEEDGYVVHNAGSEDIVYDTLEEAVLEYKNGNGEPICLIGIKNE